ncbi:murein transglycosylase [Amycolatopsis suaedae]|uniref:Murein transglycosylase n=1 Tax=Amycolatopsis suaedae TaxID=2510978 RepID=A0A4Q7J9N0_9PSEU|nr:murein transglycosylase [Amycolatopsis suaedae]RZQ63646.1 murein transglycosylase [Amycolatopsis suaedae]
MLAGVLLIVTIGIDREEPEPSGPPPFVVEELKPPPGATAPRAGLPAPEDRPNASDIAALDAWSKKVAGVTQVSARALVAYGRAEMWLRSERPECRITWVTVAGIARVESQHGGFGGAQVGVDGKVTKPIIGVPLNGSPGVKAIPDTDGGRLDGDTQWDRAVGPFQFLPGTWQRYATRAASDGAVADPQNIDDAAVTAARYLCASGGDLGTPEGWWKAVLTYNQSVAYGQDVFSGADAYAAATANLR